MISTSGGPSEGGRSSKHAASKPSGLVALNAVVAQLGECLQELEVDNFDLDHLIALVDYFKSSSNATVTYLSLDIPVLHGWLQKQLVETLGYHLQLMKGQIANNFVSSCVLFI